MSKPWTLERIYARCKSEPGEVCQIWQGTAPEGYPRISVKDPAYASGQRQINVRRLVFKLANGREAPSSRKLVLVPSCGNERCVSAECLQVVTRSRLLRAVAATGIYQSVKHRAAVSKGRSRSQRLTDQDVAQLRASDRLAREDAQRLGISRSYTHLIKIGQRRIDYASPFASLLPGQCGRK